jgi:hypothetical protein
LRPGGGSDSGIRETRRTRRACVVANAGGFGILRGARGDRAAPNRASEPGSRAGYGTPSANAYLAWSLCERVCFLRAAAYRRTMDGSMSRDVRRGEPLLRVTHNPASSLSKRRTLSKRAVLEPDEPRTEALPEPVACGSRSDGDARGSVPRRARERRMTGGTITLQSSSCLSRRHPPAQRATGTCRHVRVKAHRHRRSAFGEHDEKPRWVKLKIDREIYALERGSRRIDGELESDRHRSKIDRSGVSDKHPTSSRRVFFFRGNDRTG